MGGSGQSSSWGPTTVFYQSRQRAHRGGSWLGSLPWTSGLMSGDQAAALVVREAPGPPPAQAAFGITSGNRCMHTQTAHPPSSGHTHTHTFAPSPTVTGFLHSAAVVAAWAPRLCSGSSGSAAGREKQVQKGSQSAAAQLRSDTDRLGTLSGKSPKSKLHGPQYLGTGCCWEAMGVTKYCTSEVQGQALTCRLSNRG